MKADVMPREKETAMKVFDMVKQQIIRDLEKMEPHTRLPGRQALCDQYFASRDTIDRVIASLKRENYLYTIRNSGTFVADPSISLNISRKLPPGTIGVLMLPFMWPAESTIMLALTACRWFIALPITIRRRWRAISAG